MASAKYIAALFLGLFCFTAGAATIDQLNDQVAGNVNVWSRISRDAQSFRVGIAGELDSVDLRLSIGSDSLSWLTAEISSAQNGFPIGGVLASISLSNDQLKDQLPSGAFDWITLDFSSSNLMVNVDDELALVLNCVCLGESNSPHWSGSVNALYDFGFTSKFSDGEWTELGTNGTHDMFFRTYVTTVPIPAAFWLFGSALGLLGWMRRKKG